MSARIKTEFKRKKSRLGIVASVAIFALIEIGAVAGALFIARQNTLQSEERIRQKTEEVTATIRRRLDSYADMARGASAFFSGSTFVDSKEWSTYIDRMKLDERFPGVRAMEYVEVVKKTDLPEFESANRAVSSRYAQGIPDFKIWPESDAETRYVVTYVVPRDGNERAFGFDIGSEGRRMSAIELARDSDKVAMTAPVDLVLDIDDKRGFFMVFPVYAKGAPTGTVEERRASLRGLILPVFVAREFFGAAIKESGVQEGMSIAISDESADTAENARLFALSDQNDDDSATVDRLEFGGRRWFIRYSLPKGFGLTGAENYLPYVIALSGSAISVFIFLFMIALVTSRQRALEQIDEATAKLRHETRKYVTLINQLPVGVMMFAAPGGEVLLANPKAAEILGRAPDKEHGAEAYTEYYKLERADRSPYPTDDLPVPRTLKSGKPADSDDIFIRRPDDSRIVVHAMATPITHEDGSMYAVAAVFEDVTIRHDVENAREELVSIASHQLKTPIGAMNWYIDLFEGGDVGRLTAKQKEMMADMRSIGNHMNRMVSELLNVSRISLGTFAVDPKPTDYSEIINESLAHLKPQIEAGDLKVELSFAKRLPKIDADNGLARIVVDNLLSNAVKYSRKSGAVRVSLRQENDNLELDIQDEGIGIPAAEQGRVFERMFRADNARKVEGTGLGLHIIKRVLEQVGGSVTFVSEEGQGTTFTVRLPLTGMKARKGTTRLS